MTPDEAGQIIAYLQCAGLNPTPPQLANPGMTRTVYADALTRAGVGVEEARLAAATYAAEPDPGTFPKPFPDPGKLIARTPTAERAKAAEAGEKSAAARLFYEVVRARVDYPRLELPVVDVLGQEGNTALEAQIQAGIQAVGGWRLMGSFEEKDLQWREKEFVAAFLAARSIAKADRRLAATGLRAIEGGR
jgi:hypothetical protein